MRKIKNIVLPICILLVISLIIYFGKVFYKNNDIDRNNNVSLVEEELTDVQINKYKNFNDDFYGKGAIVRLVEKNGNWDDIPLTKHFREKYNEKDGILGDIKFDKVEYFPYEEGTFPFTRTSYFVITQGKKKTAYMYSEDTIKISNVVFYYFDDITLSDPIVFIDEFGNEVDTRLRCNEGNWEPILMFLIDNDENRQKSVAVTESFISKYESFDNAIISQTNENGACYGYKSNDFKNKIVDCYWYTKVVLRL